MREVTGPSFKLRSWEGVAVRQKRSQVLPVKKTETVEQKTGTRGRRHRRSTSGFGVVPVDEGECYCFRKTRWLIFSKFSYRNFASSFYVLIKFQTYRAVIEPGIIDTEYEIRDNSFHGVQTIGETGKSNAKRRWQMKGVAFAL